MHDVEKILTWLIFSSPFLLKTIMQVIFWLIFFFFFLKRNGQGMSKCSSLTIHANFLKTLLHNFFFLSEKWSQNKPRKCLKKQNKIIGPWLIWVPISTWGCQLALGECRLALWGVDMHAQFCPNSLHFFSMFFVFFFIFLKNIFFIWDHETLS